MSRTPVYMALIHYPVVNKKGLRIATAITNFDVHDGGRIAATYGILEYFLVSPVEEQRSLVARIHEHWTSGPGGRKNPKRKIALSRIRPSSSLEETCATIAEKEGQPPIIIGTSAQSRKEEAISYAQLRHQIHHPPDNPQPILLIFGTGWGIADDITPSIDRTLPPILGTSEYNHLSVRAAIAITLDRLLGNIDA